VETGALAGERGAYRLTRPVEALQVPAAVQTILAARIDRLPPEEKQQAETTKPSLASDQPAAQPAASIKVEEPSAQEKPAEKRSEARQPEQRSEVMQPARAQETRVVAQAPVARVEAPALAPAPAAPQPKPAEPQVQAPASAAVEERRLTLQD